MNSSKATLVVHEEFSTWGYIYEIYYYDSMGKRISQSFAISKEVVYKATDKELRNLLLSGFSKIIKDNPSVATAINQAFKEAEYATVGFITDFTLMGDDIDITPSWQIYQSSHIVDSWGNIKSPPNRRRPEVDKLPGLNQLVKYPGKKFYDQYSDATAAKFLTLTLEKCIITLNDYDKWTREQIADWLETLDIDITFRSNDEDEV